ncbi:MAG: FAD-dependent oxidoreductase, partial [Blastocatellia bacterium]
MPEAAYKADVVVIGGGLAGLAATVELLDQGRRVVLLERGPEEKFGGLARQSFGGIFFCGSPEQKRAGIRDTVELALRDWIAYGELDNSDVWPRRWAESYIAGSVDLVRGWLTERGVKFFPVLNWVERGLHQ